MFIDTKTSPRLLENKYHLGRKPNSNRNICLQNIFKKWFDSDYDKENCAVTVSIVLRI
jgi:hypothetical protein